MHTTVFTTPVIHHFMRIIAHLYLKTMGWKCVGELPQERKFIALAGPHTSNWDFSIMLATAIVLRVNLYWMGKNSLFTNPLGWFFKWLGGIPIDRSKSNKVVDQMVTLFEETDDLCVGLSPEGTRERCDKWKSGFYHIALQVKVPLILAYIDYEKKSCGIGELYNLTGQYEVDMKYIQGFYATKVARHPENFSGEYLE